MLDKKKPIKKLVKKVKKGGTNLNYIANSIAVIREVFKFYTTYILVRQNAQRFKFITSKKDKLSPDIEKKYKALADHIIEYIIKEKAANKYYNKIIIIIMSFDAIKNYYIKNAKGTNIDHVNLIEYMKIDMIKRYNLPYKAELPNISKNDSILYEKTKQQVNIKKLPKPILKKNELLLDSNRKKLEKWHQLHQQKQKIEQQQKQLQKQKIEQQQKQLQKQEKQLQKQQKQLQKEQQIYNQQKKDQERLVSEIIKKKYQENISQSLKPNTLPIGVTVQLPIKGGKITKKSKKTKSSKPKKA